MWETNTLEQSLWTIGQCGRLTEYWRDQTQLKSIQDLSKGVTDSNIFSSVAILEGTWNGIIQKIILDGTQNVRLIGTYQKTIAAKMETIDILEIQLKRENIEEYPEEITVSINKLLSPRLTVRTIDKLPSGMTQMVAKARVHSCIYKLAGETGYLYLELIITQRD